METIKKSPVTFLLIVLNIIVFVYQYLEVGTFENPHWVLYQLGQGALYNPYTLDKEWYRLFTHLFMHGHFLHLAMNMYALFSVGRELEQVTGTVHFIIIYFITGIAGAIASLYFNLFQIGVGASGAIFGLFGFSLVLQIFYSRRNGYSITPIIINFLVFIFINLLFAQAMQADNAAHFGGLAAGGLLAAASIISGSNRKAGMTHLILSLLLLAGWWSLPRYQVTYYKFFQQVLRMEDYERDLFKNKGTDEEIAEGLRHANPGWDSALTQLNAHTFLPEALHSDTLKLRKYIAIRKQENDFRIKMIDRESYIYLDSIDIANEQLGQVTQLDYVLNLSMPKEAPVTEPEEKQPLESVQVWYDSNWVEVPYPPAVYYRIGTRDSLGRWQGRVTDYYLNGDIQMKGEYRDDQRNGIFIYYSDHHTYQSAGRYVKDRHTGKWEDYHTNGRLESEVFYTDRYFLKTLYDSAGHLLVKDGNGREIRYYADSTISLEGVYKDGYKEGYWYGRHPDGKMYFEENYHHGRLVNGRAQNQKGEKAIYDESSYFPLPRGGYKNLQAYLSKETAKVHTLQHGTVKLSFRVTWNGLLTEFKVEESVSKELDEKAKELIRNGPAWLPAREHGLKPTDGYALVSVAF